MSCVSYLLAEAKAEIEKDAFVPRHRAKAKGVAVHAGSRVRRVSA